MRGGRSKAVSGALLATAVLASSVIASAQEPPLQHSTSANSSLYLKVELDKTLKLSKLRPGDMIEAKLARDVYSSDRELFPAGSRVRLTVDHLEKRRKATDDHWPWVVKAFRPRHEQYPVFKTASVAEADGDHALQVSLISISRKREVNAQARKKSGKQAGENGSVEVSNASGKPASAMMVLEAFEVEPERATAAHNEGADLSGSEILPAGTACKILLLGNLSASKSRPDDVVEARLLEPVLVNGRVVLQRAACFRAEWSGGLRHAGEAARDPYI